LQDKPDDIPLIGFCGSPFTTLLYMLQGNSKGQQFEEAVSFIYKNRSIAQQLIERVTEVSVEYVKGQCAHGIQAFQLFETHAGLIPFELYQEMVLPAAARVLNTARAQGVPAIFLPKGLGTGIAQITPDHCDFLSVDWQCSLEEARRLVHKEVGLQGNVDPRLLLADQGAIEKELVKLARFGAENQNWIFNLGHGLIPSIPVENARFVVDWVKEFDWKR
jgi:uroporphyrinogen decarboxylase